MQRLPRNLTQDCFDLRRKCQRWADDNGDVLAKSDPNMPRSTNDRAEDNYRTLAAVADVIGGDWPSRIRGAYKRAVKTQTTADTGDLSLALLTDIRDLMNERPESNAFASSVIVERLNKMQDRPWPTVTNGKEMSQYKLSELLKPYGLKSSKHNSGGNQFRGYCAIKLKEACTRYLSEQKHTVPAPPSQGGRVSKMASNQRFGQAPTNSEGVLGCTGVKSSQPPTDTLKNKGVRLKPYSDAVPDTLPPCKGVPEHKNFDDSSEDRFSQAKSSNNGGYL